MAVRLKSRTKACVGGFVVNLAQTGFTGQYWKFSDAAKALWTHIDSNPGLTTRYPNLPKSYAECEDYIDLQNAARMLTIKGAEDYIVSEDTSVPKSQPPQPPKNFAAAVGGGARKIAAGAFTLISWLGKGGVPVAPEIAEARATVCATGGPEGKKCPKNLDHDLTSIYTVKLANVLRRQLETRKDLNMSTSKDADLGICGACACPLKLKVHVDIKSIVEHMPAFVKKDLYPACWILGESTDWDE